MRHVALAPRVAKAAGCAVVFVAGMVAIVCIAAYRAGSQLVRSAPARIGPPPVELAAEPVTFRSESGATIHGWLSRVNLQRGAVLLLPSVRANRLSMVPRAHFLRSEGYSTLLIDLQATGESSADAITFGWRERLDVIAAVQFLHKSLPGEPVAIIGRSLGGAAALLATPPLHVEALVLEAVYPTIEVAVDNRLRMRMGPAGSMLTPLLLAQLRPRLGVAPSELRPVEHIARAGCPVLIIGGLDDRHTSSRDTRQLYDAAPQPKELWLIPAAGHVDYFATLQEEYRRRVGAFVGAALATYDAGSEDIVPPQERRR